MSNKENKIDEILFKIAALKRNHEFIFEEINKLKSDIEEIRSSDKEIDKELNIEIKEVQIEAIKKEELNIPASNTNIEEKQNKKEAKVDNISKLPNLDNTCNSFYNVKLVTLIGNTITYYFFLTVEVKMLYYN